jgi:hypothetical protein
MRWQLFRCPHFLPAVAVSTTYYQQLLAPPRHEVVAITVNFDPEKAGVGGSTPSLATTFLSTWRVASRIFQRPRTYASYSSVKQRLPVAHAPYVDVHEVGASIVPHASAMQAQGCVTQVRRRNSRQANVDRFGLHMQAVLRYAGVRAARA